MSEQITLKEGTYLVVDKCRIFGQKWGNYENAFMRVSRVPSKDGYPVFADQVKLGGGLEAKLLKVGRKKTPICGKYEYKEGILYGVTVWSPPFEKWAPPKERTENNKPTPRDDEVQPKQQHLEPEVEAKPEVEREHDVLGPDTSKLPNEMATLIEMMFGPMLDSRVEKRTKELLADFKGGTVRYDIKINDVKAPDLNGYIPPSDGSFEKLLKALVPVHKEGGVDAVWCIGEAGCGKTMAVEAAAKCHDLAYTLFSCTAGVQEYHVTGKPGIDSDGKTYTEDTPIKRWARSSGLLAIEELDGADPNVALLFHLMIANRILETRDEREPFIRLHDGCRIVVITNTDGGGATHAYTGRSQLDKATVDRIIPGRIRFNYNDNVEEKLVDERVLEWGRDVRKAIAEHHLRDRWVSTRIMVGLSKRLAWDDMKGVKQSYFDGWSDNDLSRIGHHLKGK